MHFLRIVYAVKGVRARGQDQVETEQEMRSVYKLVAKYNSSSGHCASIFVRVASLGRGAPKCSILFSPQKSIEMPALIILIFVLGFKAIRKTTLIAQS